MRSIYLDETGISVNESVALVAGVIINEDSQWKSVEKFVVDLIEEYVPEDKREGFSFHVKDLYFCTGKVFDHRKFGYPRERAREALKQLLSIPRRFHLPVSIGYVNKEAGSSGIPADFDASQRAKLFHALAYVHCACAAETYMMEKGLPNELARLVAENNNETHKIVKMVHKMLQGKIHSEVITKLITEYEHLRPFLPLRRIVDTVHFVQKDDAILLQLADACAFIFRYWAESKSDEYTYPYFEAFFGSGKGLDLFLEIPRPTLFQYAWTFEEWTVAEQ